MRINITKAIALLITFSVATFAQQKGTFTDSRDKKTYKTVKIGTQTWMAENLSYKYSEDEYNISAKCYGEGAKVDTTSKYGKDMADVALSKDEIQANCEKYGRLYDYRMAMKSCPKGWHLPKNTEWDKLLRFVDNSKGTESPYESETAGNFLKATSGWKNYEGKSGNGEDKFGFSALGGGQATNIFKYAGIGGYWWTATQKQDNTNEAYSQNMGYGGGGTSSDTYGTGYFFSVRCVKN